MFEPEIIVSILENPSDLLYKRISFHKDLTKISSPKEQPAKINWDLLSSVEFF